jgi:hypothetical protein
MRAQLDVLPGRRELAEQLHVYNRYAKSIIETLFVAFALSRA